MESVVKSILLVHVLAGIVSLILFWLPVATKKGGKIHNKVGKAYVVAMWIVVVTAFVLSIKNLITQDYIAAAFLGFLSVLTSAPLWYAQAILKNKKGITKGYFNLFKGLHTTIFIMGTGLVIWSIILEVQGSAVLLLIFGILGMTAFPDAFSSYQKIQTREKWIITHLRGMLSTGIAAYTAFFAFGGRQLLGDFLTDQWMAVPWILPSVIGIFGIRFWRLRYTKKPMAATGS